MLREEREACFLNMKIKCFFFFLIYKVLESSRNQINHFWHISIQTQYHYTLTTVIKNLQCYLTNHSLSVIDIFPKANCRHHGSLFIRQVLVENKNIFNVPNTFIIFSSLNFYVATISLGNGLLNSMILYLKVAFRIVWEIFPNGFVKNIIIIYNSLENN